MTGSNPSLDKCIWTARIQEDGSPIYQCIPCYVSTILRSPSPEHISLTSMIVEHCFVRGSYLPYICIKCSRIFTREKPVAECQLCYEKCIRLFERMTAQGIQIANSQFMYDVHHDKLVYFHNNP